jgi:uncharacterized membrane protein (UPF0127 family)
MAKKKRTFWEQPVYRIWAAVGAVLVVAIVYFAWRNGIVPGSRTPPGSSSPAVASGSAAPVGERINSGQWQGYTVVTRMILGQEYRLLVADTPEKQQLGLMYVKELEGYDGMIFLFPEANVQSFWNKNTLIDLRIVWMNGDQVAGQDVLPAIKEGEEPTIVRSPRPVDTVVELPLGDGI